MFIIDIEFEIYKAFKIIKKSLLIGKSKRTNYRVKQTSIIINYDFQGRPLNFSRIQFNNVNRSTFLLNFMVNSFALTSALYFISSCCRLHMQYTSQFRAKSSAGQVRSIIPLGSYSPKMSNVYYEIYQNFNIQNDSLK